MGAAMDRVFDSTTVERLRQMSAFDRCEVLTARGSATSDPGVDRKVRVLRARRAAWETYLDSADACGLLDVDLLARLRGRDDDDFRGAIAECLSAWVLSTCLGYRLTPRPAGRGTHRLDMEAERGDVRFC